MKDYLNINDEELAAFAATFAKGLEEVASLMNLTAERAEELGVTATEFREILDEINAARALQRSLTTRKNNSRKKLRQTIRSLAKMARANEAVKEPELAKLGLKIYDRTPTASAAPETAPHIIIEIHPHRRHSIKIFDFADSTNRAKPKGVSGAEIWVYFGADGDQAHEKNMRYLGMATRGKMNFTHDEENAGKQAVYMARWVNRRGVRGGWSNTATATVAI